MRALALLSLLALAGCGQKGNLYLPDEAGEKVPATIGPVITTPGPQAAPAEPAAPAPAAESAATPAPAAPAPDDDTDDAKRN